MFYLHLFEFFPETQCKRNTINSLKVLFSLKTHHWMIKPHTQQHNKWGVYIGMVALGVRCPYELSHGAVHLAPGVGGRGRIREVTETIYNDQTFCTWTEYYFEGTMIQNTSWLGLQPPFAHLPNVQTWQLHWQASKPVYQYLPTVRNSPHTPRRAKASYQRPCWE